MGSIAWTFLCWFSVLALPLAILFTLGLWASGNRGLAVLSQPGLLLSWFARFGVPWGAGVGAVFAFLCALAAGYQLRTRGVALGPGFDGPKAEELLRGSSPSSGSVLTAFVDPPSLRVVRSGDGLSIVGPSVLVERIEVELARERAR